MTKNYYIILHGHDFTLEDVPTGEKVIFIVRDPLDRFVSGFYTRIREGLPSHYNPMRACEKRAFSFFSTPNELGTALSSVDEKLRKEAIYAMNNVNHIKTSYWDWFKNEDYFLSRIDDILFVGELEKLDSDFEELKDILGFPKSVELPRGKVATNKAPENTDRTLSSLAAENLRCWFSEDYKFMKVLRSNKLI